MNTDAYKLANFFIRKGSEEDKNDMTITKILNLVYISHGLSLAIFDKPLLDPDRDIIEAWEFGPVITNLYNTLITFSNENIATPINIPLFGENGKFIKTETPTISEDDNQVREILNTVWESHKDMTPTDLIDFLKWKGTPWHYCYYKKGEYSIIPDEFTKIYFTKIIEASN